MESKAAIPNLINICVDRSVQGEIGAESTITISGNRGNLRMWCSCCGIWKSFMTVSASGGGGDAAEFFRNRKRRQGKNVADPFD